MLTNFPNGLSSFGVPVLGAGPYLSTGRFYFVHSSTGQNASGKGESPDTPFASIDYAVGRCRADKGDTIIVMPGHVETVIAAAGLALDVAGVTVLGLGRGASRPVVNYTTAVGASVTISANSVVLSNILFTGNIDALTGPIAITGTDVQLIDCEWRDLTGQATDVIIATAAHRLLLDRWIHGGVSAPGTDTGISINAGDRITIRDAYMDGNFAVACIENVTAACTNLTISGGAQRQAYFRNRNASDVIVTLLATATGNIGPNLNARLADNAANITEAFVGDDCQFFQPINIVNADGESSLQTNITASTD